MQTDSMDKIITRYFACLTRKPIIYKGAYIYPKPVVVSPNLLRGYTCPEKCGGCCPRFSLDYLPSEEHPPTVKNRYICLNNNYYLILTDMQKDHDNHHCRYLHMDTGRCTIYQIRPLSCDFELIRTIEEDSRFVLTQRLFGRGWNMLRVDGERGSRCEMLPPDDNSITEVIRKLNRLKTWTDYFNLSTWIPKIINLVENGITKTVILSEES